MTPVTKRTRHSVHTSDSCPHIRHTFIKWTGLIKLHFHKWACLQTGCFLGGGEEHICECVPERYMNAEIWRPHSSSVEKLQCMYYSGSHSFPLPKHIWRTTQNNSQNILRQTNITKKQLRETRITFHGWDTCSVKSHSFWDNYTKWNENTTCWVWNLL